MGWNYFEMRGKFCIRSAEPDGAAPLLRGLHSSAVPAERSWKLKKSIGHVTQKVLTAQLRQMEESGLLTRKVYAEVPPRVEYTLTELGYSLKPVLDAMWAWDEGYKSRLEGKAE